ncbi:MAG: serine/threonine protein kinase [Gemmatimonadetes bacterium]|nr:serine/threonine protein kinase [Gemmatimonadota bacterium]
MATVYLAHDLKHDRDVAIKVLHPDLGAALGGERFLTEIRTTARLQHPHILPLLDSGEADGLLYYVMPLVTGETLRTRLERERQLPIAEAVRLAREVADALGYAHGLGVIHRDIKPENILLQGGHALVADFGIALAVQSAGGARMTQTGLSLGTPQYMSPEQAMGEKQIDARSDIYALGAVTYEMLVGEAPFTGPSVQAIVARLITEEPRALTTQRKAVPEHIEAAVLRALEKLPADRFATATEFAAALVDSGAASGYPTRATKSRVAAAPPMPRRTRALLAVMTGAALLGTGSAAWLATRKAPAPVPALFEVALPDSVTLRAGGGRRLSLSPDGTLLVIVAERAASRGSMCAGWMRRSFSRYRGPSSSRVAGRSIHPSRLRAPLFSSGTGGSSCASPSRGGGHNGSIPQRTRAGATGIASSACGATRSGRRSRMARVGG